MRAASSFCELPHPFVLCCCGPCRDAHRREHAVRVTEQGVRGSYGPNEAAAVRVLGVVRYRHPVRPLCETQGQVGLLMYATPLCVARGPHPPHHSDGVSTTSTQLADTNDQLEAVTEQLATHGSAVSDTGPVQRIRESPSRSLLPANQCSHTGVPYVYIRPSHDEVLVASAISAHYPQPPPPLTRSDTHSSPLLPAPCRRGAGGHQA